MVLFMSEPRDFWFKVKVVTGLIAAIGGLAALTDFAPLLPSLLEGTEIIDPLPGKIDTRDHRENGHLKPDRVPIGQHRGSLIGKVKGRNGYCWYSQKSGSNYIGRCPAI